MNEGVVSAFAAAGQWFVDLASRDEVATRWSAPSVLPGYTVGGVVGHTAAAVAWIGPLLDTRPDDDPPVWSAGEYMALFSIRSADDFDSPLQQYARAQGEQSAERGPKETVTRLQARLDGVVGRIAADQLDRPVDLRPLLPAAIRLGEFLRTRVLELVVHGDDVATSAALDADPPGDASALALHLLVDTAASAHGQLEVLRALARQERCRATIFPVL
jgi:uncharacterized protein (TIGR03083 family)